MTARSCFIVTLAGREGLDSRRDRRELFITPGAREFPSLGPRRRPLVDRAIQRQRAEGNASQGAQCNRDSACWTAPKMKRRVAG